MPLCIYPLYNLKFNFHVRQFSEHDRISGAPELDAGVEKRRSTNSNHREISV